MKKNPFRFGVACGNEVTSSEDWIIKAQRVEKLGYSTLVVPDHYIEQIATIPAMAVAAVVTKTMRIGSFVINNDLRHPIMLAKEAATIDYLSNGRFELGIGAGWNKPEYDAIGMSFDPHNVRASRFEEAIQIVKNYFSDTPVDFSGQYYRISSGNGLDKIPLSIQKPHPPILIGAGGRRLLSFAARQANIIGIAVRAKADGFTPDITDIVSLPQKVKWVHAAAGDRLDDIELNVLVFGFEITDDLQRSVSKLADQTSLPVEAFLESPFYLLGSLEQIIDKIKVNREQFGISYYVIRDQDKETFAPVVASLAGK